MDGTLKKGKYSLVGDRPGDFPVTLSSTKTKFRFISCAKTEMKIKFGSMSVLQTASI